MIIPEESFTWRIKQAFVMLTSNINITIYYLLFAIISTAFLSLLWWYIFFLASKFVNLKSDTWIDVNSYVNMWYFWIIYSVISISVLILKIPFYISFVRNINDSYKWELFDKNINLKHGFTRIWKILNTYRYIFKYVSLIPCLILIVWMLVVFVDYIVWFIIIWLAILLFIYFAIFRWLRSFASLMYAVSNDEFTEDSFKKSIELTKYKVWTVFWNYVGIFLLFWLVTYFITKWFNIFVPENNTISAIITEIYNNKDNLTNEKIQTILSSINPTNSDMFTSSIRKLYDSTLTSFLYVYGVIFYFLLMKRFESEGEKNQKDIINN
jgi:hypothetical protein